jgi:hypothetical protein
MQRKADQEHATQDSIAGARGMKTPKKYFSLWALGGGGGGQDA